MKNEWVKFAAAAVLGWLALAGAVRAADAPAAGDQGQRATLVPMTSAAPVEQGPPGQGDRLPVHLAIAPSCAISARTCPRATTSSRSSPPARGTTVSPTLSSRAAARTSTTRPDLDRRHRAPPRGGQALPGRTAHGQGARQTRRRASHLRLRHLCRAGAAAEAVAGDLRGVLQPAGRAVIDDPWLRIDWAEPVSNGQTVTQGCKIFNPARWTGPSR